MKNKQKKFLKVLPERKMKDLIFQEKVVNERNEIQDISLIDEKILTIYLNNNEILTAMTICDYPEYLAVGFLFNQNMITSLSDLQEVEFNEDLSVVVVRTNKITPFETQNKKRIKTSGCAMGTIFGEMFENLVPLSSKKLETFSLSAIRAIIKDINNENKASSNVAGILWIINFRAGSPKINELPKSPLKAFTKKYQYCSVTGLSSPSSRITLSTSA